MPPKYSDSWQELTWSSANPTGDLALDQRMEAAAKAAWPYALLCAWIYLNDRDSAYDLMDHAVRTASEYARHHGDNLPDNLTVKLTDIIRSRAKRLAAKKNREVQVGSPAELERMLVAPPQAEQTAIASELFEQLSPFTQSVFHWRLLGYSWREIGQQLEMHHTTVRRAYLRELQSLLHNISLRGGVRSCD
jgi:DNA-directed RNA polymerase specialized sigma24 family protein